jgi:hypothetical protein
MSCQGDRATVLGWTRLKDRRALIGWLARRSLAAIAHTSPVSVDRHRSIAEPDRGGYRATAAAVLDLGSRLFRLLTTSSPTVAEVIQVRSLPKPRLVCSLSPSCRAGCAKAD